VCINISGFETDKPYGHRPQDRHAEINKARRTQMNVELEANQNLTSDAGENEARMRHTTMPEKYEPRHQALANELSFLRGGLQMREAGLARSPTLSAKSAALV